MMNKIIITTLIAIPFLGKPQNITNKNTFSLFHPTPTKYMRDFYTDRPDVTESPYSVDAGHVQVEMDVWNKNTSKTAFSKENTTGWGLINLKVGITNRADLQLVIESFVKTHRSIFSDKNNENHLHIQGLGAMMVRYKHNLWGNDTGKTSFAIMPFIQFPSNRSTGNDTWKGGVIFPFAATLSQEWNLGAQVEFDFNKNENQHYYTSFLQTITVGRNIYKSAGCFVEIANIINTENKNWQGTWNMGITVNPIPNIQLDTGVNLGLTPYSDTIFFIGFSGRY